MSKKHGHSPFGLFVYSECAHILKLKFSKILFNSMPNTITMNPETLYEVTSYFINVAKNEEGTSSWHDSTLAVRSEKGLHFYELTHNVDSLDKKINCLQSFLPPAKSKASSKLFTEHVINDSMRNINYTEMILDQAMWPHNAQLMDEMTCVVSFEWSPSELLPNQQSVLAVLNNIGGVDLFIKNNLKWKHVLELAGSFSDHFRKTLREPRDFTALKDAAHILSSTALSWAPTLTGDKCCYIATAQKNGVIMFWLVSCQDNVVAVHFQGSIDSGEGEVLTMRWIRISDHRFVLIGANIFGQIILLDCQIKPSLVQLNKSYIIWPDKDRMIPKQLQIITINDKIILICNKHRHLVILMIDKHYNVCGKYISNINDHRITCITNSRDEIYLTTVNCQIFKINISIDNTNLDVSLCPIACNNISSTSELYDISFSQNGVICTLITVDRKVNFRKEPLKINVVFATTNTKLNSLVQILIENPTKKLTNYWDVVELLRYKCMKHKEAPPIVYSELYEEACCDIYLLKLYLIFVTLYNNLKILFKVDPIPNIPEESLETIKEEMSVIHAEMVFRKYNLKRVNEGELEGFEKESMFGAINFLEFYCKKNKRLLTDILKFEKSDFGDVVCEYTCQGCDEKIQDFTCKNNHLNMFCSLTFTPIDSFEYLSCIWCNRTARIELASDDPKCLMCDVSLVVI